MPITIRALAFVYISVLIVHLFARKEFIRLIGISDYNKLLYSYIFVLLVAALSPGYWIFLSILLIYIQIFLRKNPDLRISLFFMLIFAVPNFTLDIPGIFDIRFVMSMSYARFLILILLLPLLLSKRHKEYAPFGFLSTDIFVLAYILTNGILGFRDNTITNAIRELFMLYIDIYIPYFVISRYVVNSLELQKILSIFVFSICVLSVVSLLETSKSWHIYNEFSKHLQTSNNTPLYLIRSGMLRASTVFYTPIALGLVATIAFGASLYLVRHIKDYQSRLFILIVIFMGLVTSLSRGPWMGFVILILAHSYIHKTLLKDTFKYFIILVILIPFLSLTSYWNTFVSLLPIIGNVEIENITYRQQLLENALLVLQKYPIFGSPKFIDEPEMQQMVQGQGIVDIVNSYIRIMLTTGIVGLILFVSIFISILISAYKIIIAYMMTDKDKFELGSTLVAILVSTLFIISTVSSIGYIPYLYWIFTGLIGAYVIMNRYLLKI